MLARSLNSVNVNVGAYPDSLGGQQKHIWLIGNAMVQRLQGLNNHASKTNTKKTFH